MKENTANAIKDTMWKFLMDKGQKSNIPALKEYVYDLIQMTTQKTAGQRKTKDHISWGELDMTMMSIVIEATALVLSGDLDKKEANKDMNASTNASWIPVEERLPEVCRKIEEDHECPEYNVTIQGAEKATTLKYSPADETWFDDMGYVYPVVAWQPLPEVYHPERSDNHDRE